MTMVTIDTRHVLLDVILVLLIAASIVMFRHYQSTGDRFMRNWSALSFVIVSLFMFRDFFPW